MTVEFIKLKIPPTPPPEIPNQLHLASNISSKNILNLPIGETPLLRSLDEIIADIQSQNLDKLTKTEWIYYLWMQPQWEQEHLETSRKISQIIWQAISDDFLFADWLKQQILWRIGVYYQNKKQLITSQTSPFKVIAETLVAEFIEWSLTATSGDALSIQILKTISQGEIDYEIANLSWKYGKTPQELLEKAQLPVSLPTVELALNCVGQIFVKNNVSDRSGVEWMVRCLQQMSPQQQLATVEILLTQVSDDILKNHRPQLIEWLRDEYSTQLAQLSEPAQNSLNRWIGALNSSYIQRFIDLILRCLQPTEFDRKQLEERQNFWANYSDRIRRVRLLLPQNSFDRLGYQRGDLSCEVLKTCPDETEVLILDLGQHFVIEFLRGIGSEARLIPKNAESDRVLFRLKQPTIQHLRKLGNEIHDHLFFWQYSCERWLAAKKIHPNADVQCFKGMLQYYGKYDRKTGLRPPEPNEQKERDSQLKQWQKDLKLLTE
ncbi:MAG: EH signature domain-containing protein [Lyngbya sp.]|nr:EH signature domain-containing protein [Lyngbya sp.]